MRIASTNGATVLAHEGAEYLADAGGVFDVPEDVGEALVVFPHWLREHEALAVKAAEQTVEESTPEWARAQIAELTAKVAELSAPRKPGRPRKPSAS